MNCYEITFGLILRALRQQWKVLLGSIVGFTAAGLIAGFVLGDDLEASPKGGTVSGMLAPDFSWLSYDENYYLSCSNQLVEAAVRVDNALSFISDAALNAEQTEQMEKLEEEFSVLQEAVLIPLWQEVASGVYVPETYMEQAEHLYEVRLHTAEEGVQSAANARKYLAQWNVPVPAPEDFFRKELTAEQRPYGVLLEAAVRYEQWEAQVTFYQQTLTQLREDPQQIAEQSRRQQEKLEQAEELLHAFVMTLQSAITEIAEDGNLDLFVFYDEMESGYYIDTESFLPPLGEESQREYDGTAIYDRRVVIHNHGYRSRQDALLTLTLFCALVGVCSGGFLAVCRQSKIEAGQELRKSKEERG